MKLSETEKQDLVNFLGAVTRHGLARLLVAARRGRRPWSSALPLVASLAAAARRANRRNFVACPIVRDTATLPCWLAEYDGELYYLGTQGSSVVGVLSAAARARGAGRGHGRRRARACAAACRSRRSTVSVMPEINPACNTVLPAEPRFTPARIADCADAAVCRTPRASSPMPYDFDSDYITLHTSRVILEAVAHREGREDRARRGPRRARRHAAVERPRADRARVDGRDPRHEDARDPGRPRPSGRVDRRDVAGEPDAPDGVNDVGRRRVHDSPDAVARSCLRLD